MNRAKNQRKQLTSCNAAVTVAQLLNCEVSHEPSGNLPVLPECGHANAGVERHQRGGHFYQCGECGMVSLMPKDGSGPAVPFKLAPAPLGGTAGDAL